ncbi:hypothetical protein COT44_01685 [Candidatus Shapirobacteria bacterium CG08_land_8_20_14_0_20_39_18]|uniref:Uncharacterized protein n=1 Tax=Candidatus Shapirobacteria bacterium CG08_land_8_20_14_0_20_39_18 TaxID=1974883 RepID=A0A2M6XDG7_9BACT|nr:MAG: hypothetical protein COT44_01685 [Candidatus Shapirobacteria bacterium CG08_land_8_20_14_0_20_39_18]PIY65207.1 MAG: hypothetical protein COY91_03265 [Candidatus Shapirobacteria bacterium CG_4_10_14_0_8_um_filter_39_15]PJE68071.1 MAG: hypothetical protein COU94_03900 [Candidatus Shapirobacteria bacterium CG10_big_fil_rev_8_21_14_0_10_38_8]
MSEDKVKQLVWDYQISPSDFLEILKGKKAEGWLNQDWAISRVLEHLNYYDAISLVPLKTLAKRWISVKSKIFSDSIRKGYEFVLQKHSLPPTR